MFLYLVACRLLCRLTSPFLWSLLFVLSTKTKFWARDTPRIINKYLASSPQSLYFCRRSRNELFLVVWNYRQTKHGIEIYYWKSSTRFIRCSHFDLVDCDAGILSFRWPLSWIILHKHQSTMTLNFCYIAIIVVRDKVDPVEGNSSPRGKVDAVPCSAVELHARRRANIITKIMKIAGI